MKKTPKLTTDPNTSLGKYSSYGGFGQAFKAAHAERGSDHTFSHNGIFFSTNCADSGDYRKNLDKNLPYRHFANGIGHWINAWNKKVRPWDHWLDLIAHPLTPFWDKNVDYQRSNYHLTEYKKDQQYEEVIWNAMSGKGLFIEWWPNCHLSCDYWRPSSGWVKNFRFQLLELCVHRFYVF